MSPEILNESLDYGRFICYAQSDIYSFSLILWEIFNCCEIDGKGTHIMCTLHTCTLCGQ